MIIFVVAVWPERQYGIDLFEKCSDIRSDRPPESSKSVRVGGQEGKIGIRYCKKYRRGSGKVMDTLQTPKTAIKNL